MSQAQLLPSFSAPSFPPLAYKGTPVLTTEMLAQAYEVTPKQIRQNFSNNRERFVEGKHFFSISGQELKNFRLCVENFDSQISTKVRVLILYTDRGCARHAKSLNTDRAWDMYELLEETFFSVTLHSTAEADSSSSGTITPALRAELKLIVDAKLSTYPADVQGKARAEIWTKFNRHFRIAEYSHLPACRFDESREFLLAMQIKAISPDPVHEQPATILFDRSKEYANRVKALEDLERRFVDFSGEVRQRFADFDHEFHRINDGTYSALFHELSCARISFTQRVVDALTVQTYDARGWLDESLSRMRLAVRSAHAANTILSEKTNSLK